MKTKTVIKITRNTMSSVQRFIKDNKIKEKDLINITLDSAQNYVIFYWGVEK